MTRLNVLIACEESAKVRDAFRARGHNAISCDLQPSRGDSRYHVQDSVLPLLNLPWDMLIAFPPCTDLAVSGARWFTEKRADGRQQASIQFFGWFCHEHLRHIPCIAIENPIGIMSTEYRRPDQIIQPWQFGHGETKATCLWLHGLPKLAPTNVVPGREQRVWKLPPSADRAKLRSETFDGIAAAMADQWGTTDWGFNGMGSTRKRFGFALDAYASTRLSRLSETLLDECHLRQLA